MSTATTHSYTAPPIPQQTPPPAYLRSPQVHSAAWPTATVPAAPPLYTQQCPGVDVLLPGQQGMLVVVLLRHRIGGWDGRLG